jgi:hypothetical protein
MLKKTFQAKAGSVSVRKIFEPHRKKGTEMPHRFLCDAFCDLCAYVANEFMGEDATKRTLYSPYINPEFPVP